MNFVCARKFAQKIKNFFIQFHLSDDRRNTRERDNNRSNYNRDNRDNRDKRDYNRDNRDYHQRFVLEIHLNP